MHTGVNGVEAQSADVVHVERAAVDCSTGSDAEVAQPSSLVRPKATATAPAQFAPVA
jgi:hypothetical protein